MSERKPSTIPAANLVNLTLGNGWVVKSALPQSGSTGGMFSFYYVVEQGARKGFLKAIDFTEAFEPGVDTIGRLNRLTAAFELERDILFLCAEKRLSKVVVAIDHGDVQVPGFDQMTGRVFYLIFEQAETDVRSQADRTNRLETLWCLRVLRDVCLGLEQIHRYSIAHQDTKPSNVLCYSDSTFRIADFGRSSRKGRSVFHDEFDVAGDRTYAPLELLYGFRHEDFAARRIGCDLYMLGNLAAFMFSGINVTANVLSRLAPEFHPSKWHGSYGQVLPHVQRAFSDTLDDIARATDSDVRPDITAVVRELCNPDLDKRGHPRSVGGLAQYSVIRYTSQLTNLSKRYEVVRRAKVRAG